MDAHRPENPQGAAGQDARASLQQIGQAVGLSASPCWERIKKLELAGVIEGYTVGA